MHDIPSAMRIFREVSDERKKSMVRSEDLFAFVEHATLSDLKEVFPYMKNVNKRLGDDTPLTLAVRLDKSDMVKFLLDNGADINMGLRDSDETPAYIAVKENNCSLFDLLLRYNPDIHKGAHCNVHSAYTRATAVGYGGVRILRSLVDHLISRDQMNSAVATDCFPKVVQNNDLVLIHTLLEYGIDMDTHRRQMLYAGDPIR
jgi:ankyrin repeat protein